MIKKLMIVPFFGELPEYMNQWIANMEYLKPYGYDYLLVSSVKLFEQRVKEKLSIEPCIISGTGKPWDFRPAFGVLFEDEIKGYDYWGHTDFDCVYGDINSFMPDDELVKYDIWTNDPQAICGPWTLYKNKDEVNKLFYECPDWKEVLSSPKVHAWDEGGFSKYVFSKDLKIKDTFLQGIDANIYKNLSFDNGKLYDNGGEIMMFHYNRRSPKKFPLGEEDL